MRKKYRIQIISLLLVVCICLLAACKKEEKKPEKEETIIFQDVSGKSYEVPLLRDVKKHQYDFDRLIEKNGYKYYTDKKGKTTSKIGIDVSKYQTDIDWKEVKKSGIDFAIIRLGFRGYGEEGRLVVDELFESHMEGALKAGLDVGVYFFSQAVTKKEAKEEAKFVLKHIKKYDITYPVIFDTEEITADASRTNDVKGKQFTQNCITFCDKIEKAGYDSMIYANMKWFTCMLDLKKLEKYEKWFADYNEKPQFPYKFQMWQYTDKGTVPGIEGNVDLNIMFHDD